MKKNWITSIALFISLAGISQQPTNIKHVILITIDGFRPDFYLDTAWHATHLRELMAGGFHANGVNSVFPSMTYPSHTTIVTGVQPARHGIYYNNMFDPTGAVDQNYWQDSSIHVPTLAHALHDKGLKSASIYWPVSANSPADYNIPDIGGRGNEVLESVTKPAGFIRELQTNLFGGSARLPGGDQNEARIAAYIIQKDPPAFMTLHLFSVDHAQHVQGRTGEMVRAAIVNADSAVGIIEEAIKQKGLADNTVLIVTGDHGFLTVTQTVNPNVWLKRAGLMNDVKTGDWKAQFNYSGGSAYLYLKDPKDKPTLGAVRKMLQELPDSAKRLFRVIERKQLDEIGGNPEVAIALTAENGAAFGGRGNEDIRPGKGGTHGYFPDFYEIRTGFIACGPGIKAGGVVGVMNLRDIAPTVAKLLGLDFPSAEGKVPDGFFK